MTRKEQDEMRQLKSTVETLRSKLELSVDSVQFWKNMVEGLVYAEEERQAKYEQAKNWLRGDV